MTRLLESFRVLWLIREYKSAWNATLPCLPDFILLLLLLLLSFKHSLYSFSTVYSYTAFT